MKKSELTLVRISKPGRKKGGAVHLYNGKRLLCNVRYKAEYLRPAERLKLGRATCKTCLLIFER